MSKNSNNKFILGIAVALLIPLFCFFLVTELSKGKVKMPGYYGIDHVDSYDADGKTKHDTVYHQVADILLTNQLGKKVWLNKDLAGKMVVIDFFFTTCPSTCPQLTSNMRMLQTGFKKDAKKEASLDTVVQFISITVDPAHDTFQALRSYADRYGANHDHWWFLTGDKKTIYDFARNQLHLTTGPGDGGADDFIHRSQFVLLDKDRFIRGYYDGLSDTDVRKCADDIVLLTLERKR
jgi:protein SCO1